MTADPDVVDLIEKDHREVERLFERLRTSPADRPLLLPVLRGLLIAHSRAEESEVYPVARDEAGEVDEVAHSQEEHEEAERLLEALTVADPDTPEFETRLTELVDAVTHHVQEEESTVLPGMRARLSDERRRALAEAFTVERAKHLGDEPGDATREELVIRARNAGIAGAADMTKEELRRRLP
jgi:hemerythrin superfamily protein